MRAPCKGNPKSVACRLFHLVLLAALLPPGPWGAADAAPGRPSPGQVEKISIDYTTAPKVRSVDFSPDSRYVVSASSDRVVGMWDVRSGERIRTFTGRAGSGRSARFSPDGRFILASTKGSFMHALKLWNAHSGETIREFTPVMGVINSVCFGPNGALVLSGGEDNIMKLWEVGTGEKIRVFKDHWGDVNSVCFSPDGARVLSGASDHNLRLWDVNTGRLIRTFRGHSDWVRSVCFSPDGRSVLSGSDDHDMRLWDADSGETIRVFTGHEGDVNSVSFHPDGERVLSGGDDRAIRLWEAPSGRPIRILEGHSDNVNSVCFDPNGEFILSGSSDGSIRLWSLSTGEEIVQMAGLPDGQWATLTPGGFYAASTHGEKYIRLTRGGIVDGVRQVASKYNRPDLVRARVSNSGFVAAHDQPSEKETVPETAPRLPPILSIESIRFSTDVLEAGRTGRLFVTLKNTGPGDARDVYVTIAGTRDGISHPAKAPAPLIEKRGGRCTVEIPIAGEPDLQTSRAYMDIRVVEPHFKVELTGRRVRFDTRKARAPRLILAGFNVSERESPSLDGVINPNEIVDGEWTIRNAGDGEARDVSVSVENSREGVLLLGVVAGDRVTSVPPRFDVIAPGEYKTVVFRYFINSDFSDKSLQFLVTSSEKSGKYGFSQMEEVPIHALGEEGGAVHPAGEAPPRSESPLETKKPPAVVEIEYNLPKTRMKNRDGIALVIGNGNYEKLDDVDYAINDAVLMKTYLLEVFGFKEGNIFLVKNASKGDLELYLGSATSHRGRLFNAVKPHKSDVFVFYSGHGAPGPAGGKGCLAPVEANPDYFEIQGYALDTFYRNLDKIPARSITVVVDACFSGLNIPDSRSGTVEIDLSAPPLDNGVVLTSSRSNQASTWHDEKKHGLFTYFFLKAIHDKNADFNKDGRLTLDEMHQYLSDETEGVPYHARRLHGVDQTPTIAGPYQGKVLIRY